MNRRPRNGDVVVQLTPLHKGICPSDNERIGNWLDGLSRKQFHGVVDIGDEVVTGPKSGGKQVPLVSDQVNSVVHCAEFPCVTGGMHGPNPL